jgi:hypothetical protein
MGFCWRVLSWQLFASLMDAASRALDTVLVFRLLLCLAAVPCIRNQMLRARCPFTPMGTSASLGALSGLLQAVWDATICVLLCKKLPL